jgi:hypothetical protein
MGNMMITQNKKDTFNSDDKMQVSEQSIIIGFVIIIILYMTAHCTYNYNKCNNGHEHKHEHNIQLTQPIMAEYGNIIRNDREKLYHNKKIPNMTDYDTSRLRYSVRTAEGGDLVEHLDTKCKSSYTNDEINCVQSYIARSKNGGSAVSSKYNNSYDRESDLLAQDNTPMSMNSGWSPEIGSGVSDSSYDIDGQSYYGSANRGLSVNANAGNDTIFNNANNSYDTDLNRGYYGSTNRGLSVNANAGNDTRFNNANNSYNTDLNRGNYGSTNRGLSVNANAGNDTRFNNANNSYDTDLNRGNYDSVNRGLKVNANAGNDTRFNNANNSYNDNLNINKPNVNYQSPQSSNVTNYSDAILQRNKINSIDKDSTTNNRMRAGSYGPSSSYTSGSNANNSYSTNANSLSNQLNIGRGGFETFNQKK